MLPVPSSTWSEAERLKWSIKVAKQLRWSEFTMEGFGSAGNDHFDVTVTSALDDVRLDGLRAGMPISVSPAPTFPAQMIIGGAWVAADNELTIRLVNVTATPLVAAAATWTYFGVIL